MTGWPWAEPEGPPRSTGTWTVPALASTTAFLTNRPGVDAARVVARDVDLGAAVDDEAARVPREVQVEGVEPVERLMPQLSNGTRTTSVVTPGVKVSVPLWPW